MLESGELLVRAATAIEPTGQPPGSSKVAGDVQVDQLEERQHVLAGVALAAVVEHLAGGDVQGCE